MKQLIAGSVALRVIGRLETVDVDEGEDESPIRATDPVDLPLEIDKAAIASKRSGQTVEARVPAAQLDGMMDSVAGLGKERRRHLTGADVTDQYSDLEARLRSTIALRDRLQQLLSRAATLDEVLTLEKQIARLQSDIDALQARIDQLKSRTELASLAVSLERKHVLGPLAVVGRGVGRLVGKLFVLR